MAYVTVSDYKQYKGIDNDDDDAMILRLIDAAESWINRECGRTLVASSDTTRYYHSYEDVDGRTLILDHVLAAAPTTVTIDGTSLASTEYTTYPRNDAPYIHLIMKQGSLFAWVDDNAAGDYEPEDAIAVTGKFGWFSSAPEDVKDMVRRLVDWSYAKRDAGAFETIAIPGAGAIEIPTGFPVDVARRVRYYKRLM